MNYRLLKYFGERDVSCIVQGCLMRRFVRCGSRRSVPCGSSRTVPWFVEAVLVCVCLCLVAAISFAGCSSSSLSGDGSIATGESSSTDTGFTVTDMTEHRSLHFDKPAERVVALAASDVEILYAVGAGNTIVARGTYCDYPAEASSITDVGSGELTSIEAIIALKPDVVIMSKMGNTLAQVNALENAGLKVIVNDVPTIERTYDYIDLLGTIVGHRDEAAQVIDDMKRKFEEAHNKMYERFGAQSSEHSVYYEVSPLQYGLWTAGSGTYMHELSEILCMQNAFGDVTGWSEVSQEQVIARNPSIIIAVTMYDGEGQRPEDEICARAGWDTIAAVKNGSVYNVDSNTITRPGPRLADAATEICNLILGK